MSSRSPATSSYPHPQANISHQLPRQQQQVPPNSQQQQIPAALQGKLGVLYVRYGDPNCNTALSQVDSLLAPYIRVEDVDKLNPQTLPPWLNAVPFFVDIRNATIRVSGTQAIQYITQLRMRMLSQMQQQQSQQRPPQSQSMSRPNYGPAAGQMPGQNPHGHTAKHPALAHPGLNLPPPPMMNTGNTQNAQDLTNNMLGGPSGLTIRPSGSAVVNTGVGCEMSDQLWQSELFDPSNITDPRYTNTGSINPADIQRLAQTRGSQGQMPQLQQ